MRRKTYKVVLCEERRKREDSMNYRINAEGELVAHNERFVPYVSNNEWWFDDLRGHRRGPFISEEQAVHRAKLAEEMYGGGE